MKVGLLVGTLVGLGVGFLVGLGVGFLVGLFDGICKERKYIAAFIRQKVRVMMRSHYWNIPTGKSPEWERRKVVV
jgi:hypothetical protein